MVCRVKLVFLSVESGALKRAMQPLLEVWKTSYPLTKRFTSGGILLIHKKIHNHPSCVYLSFFLSLILPLMKKPEAVNLTCCLFLWSGALIDVLSCPPGTWWAWGSRWWAIRKRSWAAYRLWERRCCIFTARASKCDGTASGRIGRMGQNEKQNFPPEQCRGRQRDNCQS